MLFRRSMMILLAFGWANWVIADERANAGVELPAATMSPYRNFPEKVGESVAAHKLGDWRWYQANPLTQVELKTRPFWVYKTYHGGWYHDAGYQPNRGGFHMVNPFGVWQHDNAQISRPLPAGDPIAP